MKINDTVIKQVHDTKFLGVTIDENLNWDKHIKHLKQKLYHSVSTLSLLRKNLPQDLYKDIYFTLFESHLTYCISVWGGIQLHRYEQLHRIQKKAIRILFGDLDAYKDEFKTWSRTRLIHNQILDSTFYTKEHTKPLFHKHNILTVQNLYHYHIFNESYKMFKFKSPSVMLSHYNFSNRQCLTYTKVLPPPPDNFFIYKSSIIFNTIRAKLKINDLSAPLGQIKNLVRRSLHTNQHAHHEIEWLPSTDFNIGKISNS